MTQIMLKEEDILIELKQYQKWRQAYIAGRSQEECPALPENKYAPKYNAYGLFGAFIHLFIFLGIEISMLLRIQKFVAFFAKLRISTDKF